MNRSFDNIEYRPFPGQDHLVGYAPLSGVWHIRKSGGGNWYAQCQTRRACGIGAFYAVSLQEVSNHLRCC